MGKFGERKIRFGEKIRKIIIKMWKLAKKKVATLAPGSNLGSSFRLIK